MLPLLHDRIRVCKNKLDFAVRVSAALEAAWAVTEHLDQTVHNLGEFVVVLEGWLPLGEFWRSFVKAIVGDNFADVVDSTLYYTSRVSFEGRVPRGLYLHKS